MRLEQPALLHHDVETVRREPGLLQDSCATARHRIAMTSPRRSGTADDDIVPELRPHPADRDGRQDPGGRRTGGGPDDHEFHQASYRRTTRRSAVTETTLSTRSAAPSPGRNTRSPSARSSHVPSRCIERSLGPIPCSTIVPSDLSSKEARPREGGNG